MRKKYNMEYVIFYFSGTGNTELIAEEIAKRLQAKSHSIELISIEELEKIKRASLENKIVGFGFPVYKLTYPDIFDRVLPEISNIAEKSKCFVFSTYTRFAANALYDFSRRLDQSKFEVIAEGCFKAPSCGISARRNEEDYDYESVMFFENNIAEKLDAFVNSILSGNSTAPKQKYSLINELKKVIAKDIEITKYPRINIDNSKCTCCGVCAKKCPDKNLIKTETQIDIIDSSGCLHCLRCINHCPANAITFGELTVGDNQYTIKERNRLYKKAAEGYHEKYWDNFSETIKKWQRNTVKYWIQQKFSSGN